MGFKQFSLKCSNHAQVIFSTWKAAFLLLALVLTAPAQAEDFTSAEFLKWKLASQKNYFWISIGMAGLIAGQNDKKQARCIERWFAENERDAMGHILEAMRRFPEYHPRGVILAVLKKQCGSFEYRNR
jgi:hypothetical protein